VNAVTLGDAGHGKTQLTSNISKVASKEFKPGADAIKPPKNLARIMNLTVFTDNPS
jgi:translation elongation factor EF-Tu-like GTPase